MPLYDSAHDRRAANLVISSADDDRPGVHQLIKLHYFSGICGIVIGFVALLATGMLSDFNERQPPVREQRRVMPLSRNTISRPPDGPVDVKPVVYYVVGSREQRLVLEATADYIAQQSSVETQIYVIENPQQEAEMDRSISFVVEALHEKGVPVQKIDLRRR